MEKVVQLSSAATCLAIHPLSGALVLGTEIGEIISFPELGEYAEAKRHEPEFEVLVKSDGSPAGIAFDSSGRAFIADVAHQALLTLTEGEEIANIVDEYEHEPFKGPNSVAIDSKGTIFFSDGGPFGQTGLHNATASLYAIVGCERTLQPILHKCLTSVGGIAVSADDAVLYVADTMNNQILRLVQRPANVVHASVFYRFNGGLGPTALCVDASGNLYVARADMDHVPGAAACVSVLSAQGVHLGDVDSPAPEISAIVFGTEDNPFLYVAESSSQSIYRIPVDELPL